MAEGRTPSDETEEEAPNYSDSFASQTRNIFKNFVYERFVSLIHKGSASGDMDVGDTMQYRVKELMKKSEEDRGSAQEKLLGKKLAECGDKLNVKYKSIFVEMIGDLQMTSRTAYSTFAKVARRLIQQGITWGRIVALLLFGFEIAVSVLEKGAAGIRDFLREIVDVVVKFIINEKIAQWIKDQGGWFAFLNPSVNDQEMWIKRIAAGSALVLCLYLFSKWRNPTHAS